MENTVKEKEEKIIPYEQIWDNSNVDYRIVVYFPMLEEPDESYLKQEIINFFAYYKLHKEEIDATKDEEQAKNISPYYHIIVYWFNNFGLSEKLYKFLSDLKIFRCCVKYLDRNAERLMRLNIVYAYRMFSHEEFRKETTAQTLTLILNSLPIGLQREFEDIFERKNINAEHISEDQAQKTINFIKLMKIKNKIPKENDRL